MLIESIKRLKDNGWKAKKLPEVKELTEGSKPILVLEKQNDDDSVDVVEIRFDDYTFGVDTYRRPFANSSYVYPIELEGEDKEDVYQIMEAIFSLMLHCVNSIIS